MEDVRSFSRESMVAGLSEEFSHLDIVVLDVDALARGEHAELPPGWKEIGSLCGTDAVGGAMRMWQQAVPALFPRLRQLLEEHALDVLLVRVTSKLVPLTATALLYVIGSTGDREPGQLQYRFGPAPVVAEAAPRLAGSGWAGHVTVSSGLWAALPGSLRAFYTELHDGFVDVMFRDAQGMPGVESLCAVGDHHDPDDFDSPDFTVFWFGEDDHAVFPPKEDWPDLSKLARVYTFYTYNWCCIDVSSDGGSVAWELSQDFGLQRLKGTLDECLDEEFMNSFGVYPEVAPPEDVPPVSEGNQAATTAAVASVFGCATASDAVAGAEQAEQFDISRMRSLASERPIGLTVSAADTGKVTAGHVQSALEILRYTEYAPAVCAEHAIGALAGLVGAETESVLVEGQGVSVIISAMHLPNTFPAHRPHRCEHMTPQVQDCGYASFRAPGASGISVGQEVPTAQGGAAAHIVSTSGQGKLARTMSAHSYIAWLDGRHAVALFAVYWPPHVSGDIELEGLRMLHARAIEAVRGGVQSAPEVPRRQSFGFGFQP